MLLLPWVELSVLAMRRAGGLTVWSGVDVGAKMLSETNSHDARRRHEWACRES